MSSTSRLIAGLVVVGTLLGAAVAVRLYVSSSQPNEPESRRPRVASVSKRPTVSLRRGTVGGGPSSFDDTAPSDDAMASAGRSIRREPPPMRGSVESAPGVKSEVTGAAPPAPLMREPGRVAVGTEAGQESTGPVGTPPAPGGPALSLSFDGSVTAADQTAPIWAQDVQIDPNGGAALFPPTAVLAYPDRGGIDPEQGTVALWIDVKEPSGPDGRAVLGLGTGTWPNRMDISVSPTYLRFLFATSDGVEGGVGSGIDWKKDEWHHVAVTWGEAQSQLYVDGALVNEGTYAGSFSIPPDTPLYVASPRGRGDAVAGTVAVRGLQIFQRILSGDEIITTLDQTTPPKP